MQGYPDIRIIVVPYDSGHPGLRMGAGPEHLLNNGLGEVLRSEGRGARVITVRHHREPTAEVATAFELDGLVSDQVRRALAEDEFPLVLSGNCNTAAVGTLSGAAPEELGVVWFDAHGEFNTPELAESGPAGRLGPSPRPYSPKCVEGRVLGNPYPGSCIDRLLEGARGRSEGLWTGTPASACCGLDKDAQGGHLGPAG